MTQTYEKHGFEMLSGDVNYWEYGGVFAFKKPTKIGFEPDEEGNVKQHNAYFVVNVVGSEDIPEHRDEENPDVWICAEMVCPGGASAEAKKQAWACCAWDGLEPDELEELQWVEMLHNYGTSAYLSIPVVNPSDRVPDILKKAHPQDAQATVTLEEAETDLGEENIWKALAAEAEAACGLVGFRLDQRQNLIGQTGWEALQGDMDSAFNRMREQLGESS